MGKLYKFNDIFKETIWGGTRILPYKGLPADDRKIGESWELSCVPGSESIVCGGEYDGYTLSYDFTGQCRRYFESNHSISQHTC